MARFRSTSLEDVLGDVMKMILQDYLNNNDLASLELVALPEGLMWTD